MKKRLLTQLIFFLLLAVACLDMSELRQALTMAKISGPLPFLPAVQVKLLQSDDRRLRQDAEEMMKKTLLKYFAPEANPGSWEARHIFVHLRNDRARGDPDLVAALTLPASRGILAVLHKETNGYYLYCFRDNLPPLTELGRLRLGNNNESFYTKGAAPGQACVMTTWDWDKGALVIVGTANCDGRQG